MCTPWGRPGGSSQSMLPGGGGLAGSPTEKEGATDIAIDLFLHGWWVRRQRDITVGLGWKRTEQESESQDVGSLTLNFCWELPMGVTEA